MRAATMAVTALILAGVTTSVVAAPGPRMAQMKAHMAAMQASNPQGFAACQSLASSRGYRIGQPNDYDYWGLMSFIDGCLMGKQH